MTSTTGTTNGTSGDTVVFPEPDEIEGFWALDKMHAPRPITPLSFDVVVRTLTEGFTKAQAEYDCPIMVSYNEVNHYFYVAFHPIPDEAEVQDRLTRYHDKLAEKVPSVGKTWDEEWKPEVKAKNEAAKTVDYSGLSDAELVAKLDEFTDHMRYQWWIHGHINFVLLSSSAFCDLYDKLMEPEQTTESYQTLQGFHTRSVDVQRGLWDLSRIGQGQPRPAGAVPHEDARRGARGPRRPPTRARPSAASSTTSSSSSAGAATPSTTWPTSRGGRIRRSRSPASARFIELDDSQDPERPLPAPGAGPRGADGQRSGQAGRRPGHAEEVRRALRAGACTASRSPRTTPSTSTSSASSVFRRFVHGRRRPAGGEGRPRLGRRRALPLPRRAGRGARARR